MSTITEQVGNIPEQDSVEPELEGLQKQLEKAVDEENYEEAARLRDLISEYKQTDS